LPCHLKDKTGLFFNDLKDKSGLTWNTKKCYIELKLKEKTNSPLHKRIQLRIVPDKESGLSEVRFLNKGELLGIQKAKNIELNLVRF